MTSHGETAILSDAVGEGLCSSVEMVLVVQTMSYINYELDIWVALDSVIVGHCVTQSRCLSGFSGDNNIQNAVLQDGTSARK